MTPTDELRDGLTKRGVEWRKPAEEYWVLLGMPEGDSTTIVGELSIEEATDGTLVAYNLTPEQAIEATLGPTVTGETSDGYHTFNELYHHRALLFSVVVRDHTDLAWKSKAHHDGTMYDDMFIVGIETPQGQATYHYDIDPYWEMFDCVELDRAPEWDGHTPDEAIARIATLGRETCHMRETTLPFVSDGNNDGYYMICSECGFAIYMRRIWAPLKYCSNCGRKVVYE